MKVGFKEEIELSWLFAEGEGIDVWSSCFSFCELQVTAPGQGGKRIINGCEAKDSEHGCELLRLFQRGMSPLGNGAGRNNTDFSLDALLEAREDAPPVGYLDYFDFSPHGLFFRMHTAIKNKFSFLHWLYLHIFGIVDSDVNSVWY